MTHRKKGMAVRVRRSLGDTQKKGMAVRVRRSLGDTQKKRDGSESQEEPW